MATVSTERLVQMSDSELDEYVREKFAPAPSKREPSREGELRREHRGLKATGQLAGHIPADDFVKLSLRLDELGFERDEAQQRNDAGVVEEFRALAANNELMQAFGEERYLALAGKLAQ